MIHTVVAQLKAEEHRLTAELKKIQAAIAALGSVPASAPVAAAKVKRAGKRGPSAAGVARIIAAQKARWAAYHAAKAGKTAAPKKPSKMSPAVPKKKAGKI